MTEPAGTSIPDAPSVRSLVALLVLVGMALASVLVLYIATPVAQRPDVWALLAQLGPSLVVILPAALSYIGIRKVRAVNAQQSAQLATIHRNTNGVLDGRIRNGVRDVLSEAGIIPVTVTEQAATVPAPAPPSD